MIVALGVDEGSDERFKWLGDFVEWLDSTLGPAEEGIDAGADGRPARRAGPT